MACNIIMNETGAVRTTQLNPTTTYEIEDINFYVPARLSENNQIFALIRNNKNLYDIIELVRAKEGNLGTNILYKVPLKQALRIKNEQVSLKLLLIDHTTGDFFYGSNVNMKIATNNYQIGRKIVFSQQLTQEIQNLYLKILSMTEENHKLYKKIQEKEKQE